MNTNQIIKTSYHGFAFLFLFYLAFFTKLNNIIKFILVFLAIFHLYDTYWFFVNEKGNAPI